MISGFRPESGGPARIASTKSSCISRSDGGKLLTDLTVDKKDGVAVGHVTELLVSSNLLELRLIVAAQRINLWDNTAATKQGPC